MFEAEVVEEAVAAWPPVVDDRAFLDGDDRAFLDGDDCGWVTVDCDPGDDVGPDLVVAAPVRVDGAGPSIAQRLAGIGRAVGELATQIGPIAALATDAELMASVAGVQHAANLLVPADAAILAEIERRGLPERYGYPSLAALVTGELQARPAAATLRARAARQFVARTDLLGQSLPPRREAVAAALAEGAIDLDRAVTVDRALECLAVTTAVEVVAEVEAALVCLARRADATVVARAARFARESLDPDGTAPRDAEIDRRRTLTLGQDDDGMGHIRGVLTPECLAALQAVLSPLAAPATTHGPDGRAREGAPAGDPAADTAQPDPRPSGQRLHDALLDAAVRLLGSGTLPDHGGTPTTLAVTLTAEQLRTATGVTTTPHGGTVPVGRLLELAAEAQYVPVVLDDAGGVLSYGTTRRIAPPAMAAALRARDHGCTFPGCTRPAGWTERHHVVEHRHGGPTSIDNLALVCRYHHRSFGRLGWSARMIEGRPWWVPPAELDPQQRPRRNTHWDPPSSGP